MKIVKLVAILLAASLLLCGCGATSKAPAAAGGDYVLNESPELGRFDKESSTEATNLPINQKLIRKVWMDAETEDMTALLSSVEEQIAQLGGYVEGRQIKNGSAYSGVRYRYADLTVRIPAEKLDSFVSGVSKASNITSTRETTEDVTLSYVENESKVVALEAEQTRLLELLAQAKTMDDILKIENRLTNIRSQLEQLKSQLRLYDNLVSYSTVYLNITEVREYTPITEPENMWDRIGAGLSESWKDLVGGLEDLFVVFVVALPYLVLWGLIITGVVFVVRAVRRKRKARRTPPVPPQNEE
jgi:hypothetical protein